VGSCNQVEKENQKRWNDDLYYKDELYLKDQMSDTFAKEFGKTSQEFKDMSFADSALHGDQLFCERFEGYHKTSDFSEDEWENMYLMMNAILLNPFSDHSRQLMVTKQLMKPLDEIRRISKN
jgi:hypothetical protein